MVTFNVSMTEHRPGDAFGDIVAHFRDEMIDPIAEPLLHRVREYVEQLDGMAVTKAEAICMDITTMLPSTNTYELSGQYSDTDAILKALKKAVRNRHIQSGQRKGCNRRGNYVRYAGN